MNRSWNASDLSVITTRVSGNDTSSAEPIVASYVALVVVHLIGFPLNAIMAIMFLTRITKVPFDFYFLSLLAVNALFDGIMLPFSSINAFYPHLHIGEAGCVFYVYAVYVFNIAQPVNHAVIALNRIWAMVHPISFREAQSRRLVGRVIAVMWIIPHAIALSTATVSVTARHADQIIFCFNFVIAPSLAEKISENVQKIIGLVSFLITSASIPMVIWKLRKREKVKENSVHPSSTGSKRTGTTSQPIDPATNSTQPSTQSATLPATNNTSATAQPAANQPAVPTRPQASAPSNETRDRDRSQENQANLFMGVLGISILMCWEPYAIYFGFQNVFGYFNAEAFATVIILSNLQSVAEPILLFLTLPKWRKAITDYFAACRTH
ncbi:5-hydroxytryptamine receptor 1D-like [Paramacrobiotus metropolitanus]|uniref:5-hydroxytryptamine receptor 1D-like n=1 Tax=Paramacrobiotus metropolitanus TaxID=2943436 RepID=UPI002445E94E|nr:5-hydroxytryptamine receptor 1D-like [Paramacrobiotus metropolitanus]